MRDCLPARRRAYVARPRDRSRCPDIDDGAHRYVPEIKKVTLIKDISPTQSIWSLYYTFPSPVSPRVFTVLQTKHLVGEPSKKGYVVRRLRQVYAAAYFPS